MNFRDAEPFFTWAYRERAVMVRRLRAGEEVPRHEMLLSFTRHCPVLVSDGPAGPNGAVKGVGFIPSADRIEGVLEAYMDHIEGGFDDGYSGRGLDLLVEHMWGEGAEEGIDSSLLGTLEMARRHTWANVSCNPRVALVYFQPPGTSFEIRGRVEIHETGTYHRFINAQHDVYHRPNPDGWKLRPAYLVHAEEVWDNSASPRGFGRRIL